MIGNNIIRFESLDSTSNYVANSLMSGAYNEGDVILAQYQTSGRGQRGSIWQSLPGENLTISFAIRIGFLAMHQQFLLSKVISVAIHAYLSESLPTDVAIKWPNDILVNDRKVSGMLIETKQYKDERYAIVGIGLNINQMKFPLDLKATSLALELGHKVATANVCNSVLKKINSYLELLLAGSYDEIRSAYLSKIFGYNDWIQFKTETKSFTGKIADIDDIGLLMIKSKQGHANSYQAKEIQIIY